MKKRKNILLFTLVLSISFVLAACGNASSAGKSSVDDVSTRIEETRFTEEGVDGKDTKSAEGSGTAESKTAQSETTGSETAQSETAQSEATGTAKDGKILIAYYSHTGTTEEAAKKIAKYTGGDLAEIRRAEEYGNVYEEAEAEILDGVHPEIIVSKDNLEEYDIIFVGYPNMEQGFESVLCV